MANANLHSAKEKKNDEFYTQLNDIGAEIPAYLEYNPDVFRDKTILCPCDDPEWSNFTLYFAQNFTRFGLKKLICTSYAKSSGSKLLTLIEKNSPNYDEKKHLYQGKLYILERDTDGSGRIDIDDVEFRGYLEEDGDFRSSEVKALRDESDIIITNPPFSLFREFLAWIMEAKKQFIIIGNKNAITYKDVFKYIKNNELWLGCTHPKEFIIPENNEDRGNLYVRTDGQLVAKFGNICWFTNIEHGVRHKPMRLDTMANNLRCHKLTKCYCESLGYFDDYPHYDNYDAIEVKYVECIPSDYNGMMGVPITFLDKYCPEQFEIVGLLQSSTDEQAGIPNLRYYNDFKEMRQDMTYTGASGGKANGNPVIQGKSEKGNFLYNPITKEYVHSVYARILIRRKSE